MKTIKILGSGCANCKNLEENVKIALEKTGIKANVEKITDIEEIMNYDIMSNPGLVIDEEVVSYGKINSVEEIIELLEGNKEGCCGGNDFCCSEDDEKDDIIDDDENDECCCHCKNC